MEATTGVCWNLKHNYAPPLSQYCSINITMVNLRQAVLNFFFWLSRIRDPSHRKLFATLIKYSVKDPKAVLTRTFLGSEEQ